MSAGPFAAVLTAFDKRRVEYMIIGGQAAVAYGASQFTRDADFWVNPTIRNTLRLRKALADIGAVPRFLPPLKLNYLKKGHGVHFRFEHGEKEYFIDILGRPPRVLGFSSALKDTLSIRWHGVKVPVIDIFRLVATKKTDRDNDYLVIRTLMDMVFDQAKRNAKDRIRTMSWLARESRSAPHLLTMARTWRGGKIVLMKSRRPAAVLAAKGASVDEIEKALEDEKNRLQRESREYWRPFLRELRQIRQRLKNGAHPNRFRPTQ